MKPDALGDRMVTQYERVTRTHLPRRTYTIIRIDGRAFHSFTSRFNKPFDGRLHQVMCLAAVGLCRDAQGCCLGYVQSDEASFLLTDFERDETQAWFDGLLQKICSVAASRFTAVFNKHLGTEATFDCRVFTIPDPVEVENYFIWRNKDAMRNSVQGLAQSMFSPKELHGKDVGQLKDMCQAKGSPWNVMLPVAKYGSIVQYTPLTEAEIAEKCFRRATWEIASAWVFTENRADLSRHIPRYEVAP